MSNPLRLGLIGAGRWGQVYLKNICADAGRFRLTHLASRYPEHATLLPYPVTVTPNWRDLLMADLDGVIIATPAPVHAEMLEACVAAGIPTLVEKPLCTDVKVAERLKQAVDASRVPVLVNHSVLFYPAYQALKAAIQEAGDPIRVILSEGGALGPFRSESDALWDWCPHDVSVCLDLLGGRPSRVAAQAGPVNPKGAAEMISLRLDFSDGACAWIQAGPLRSRKRRSVEVFTDNQLFRFDDAPPPTISAAPFPYAQRYAQPVARELNERIIEVGSSKTPMETLLGTFAEGLSGGSKELFGLDLAVDVVRALADCERLLSKEHSSK